MAENKKSFTAYCDWNTTFNALPDEIAGRLIKHLFAYVNDENPETDDVLINAVFANIKATLKRDLIKWREKSDKNKENALLRWNKNDANGCERIKSDANHADSDKDSDSVKGIVIKDINPNLSVDWQSLLNSFNELTGKKTKLINEKTKRQINARLKEGYSKQDLWNAILNCFNDPYHKENPKYLTLEFISRSDKMEKYSADIKKPKNKEDRL